MDRLDDYCLLLIFSFIPDLTSCSKICPWWKKLVYQSQQRDEFSSTDNIFSRIIIPHDPVNEVIFQKTKQFYLVKNKSLAAYIGDMRGLEFLYLFQPVQFQLNSDNLKCLTISNCRYQTQIDRLGALFPRMPKLEELSLSVHFRLTRLPNVPASLQIVTLNEKLVNFDAACLSHCTRLEYLKTAAATNLHTLSSNLTYLESRYAGLPLPENVAVLKLNGFKFGKPVVNFTQLAMLSLVSEIPGQVFRNVELPHLMELRLTNFSMELCQFPHLSKICLRDCTFDRLSPTLEKIELVDSTHRSEPMVLNYIQRLKFLIIDFCPEKFPSRIFVNVHCTRWLETVAMSGHTALVLANERESTHLSVLLCEREDRHLGSDGPYHFILKEVRGAYKKPNPDFRGCFTQYIKTLYEGIFFPRPKFLQPEPDIEFCHLLQSTEISPRLLKPRSVKNGVRTFFCGA